MAEKPVASTSVGLNVESYYFGCWERVGHGFLSPGMRGVVGPVTPWGFAIDSKVFSYSEGWHIEKRDGWTAMGRRDNTVDSRPGSHSTFVFHAVLTLEEAEAQARHYFPEIFERTGW